MINEIREGYEVNIIATDMTTPEGKDAVFVDVLVDGKSLGDGEVSYESLFEEDMENLPHSLRFLASVLSAIGEFQ